MLFISRYWHFPWLHVPHPMLLQIFVLLFWAAAGINLGSHVLLQNTMILTLLELVKIFPRFLSNEQVLVPRTDQS